MFSMQFVDLRMYRSPAIALWAAAIGLALTLGPHAACAALPDIDVSGFGTAGFAITDTDKATFVRSQAQPVGVDETGDVGLDSLLAVQATVHLSDMFSVTGQAMVRMTVLTSSTAPLWAWPTSTHRFFTAEPI
jgi:hypothetical protein